MFYSLNHDLFSVYSLSFPKTNVKCSLMILFKSLEMFMRMTKFSLFVRIPLGVARTSDRLLCTCQEKKNWLHLQDHRWNSKEKRHEVLPPYLTYFLKQVEIQRDRHELTEFSKVGEPVVVFLTIEVWVGYVIHTTAGSREGQWWRDGNWGRHSCFFSGVWQLQKSNKAMKRRGHFSSFATVFK